MGMTATCPGCGHSEPSSNRRGAHLGACPKCGTQMKAHTAGKAKGRYECPVTGWVFTLGMRYSVQLEEPMRLVFIPGWDNDRREDDPARPGWLRPVRYHRTGPREQDQVYLDRAAGRVFGPGCALSRDFTQPPAGSSWHGQAGVYLVPAPGTDPATWFVNGKLTYRKCAACTKKVVVNDRHLMTGPWAPRRETFYGGSGRSLRKVVINPGPHRAGTYACQQCDPRITDPEPF